ncbi:hypothetical protein Bca52824_080817 [Brassica carinata]|uniref:Uncharacterized protein n=1 Tax=Brassica carinata TaxID=52824 RepID=A0A8X7TRB6_BRACI|nr:hypothetical protein Bca52824_080817 [Brassica carinata]
MSRSGGSRSGDGEAIRGNHCVRDNEDTRIQVGDDDGKSRAVKRTRRRRGGTVAARPFLGH